MGKIGIIIGREFNTRVRKKSFILTTILTPLLMVGLIAAVGYMSTRQSDTRKEMLVVDHSGIIAPQLHSEGRLVFTPSTQSYEQLKAQKQQGVFGILVIGGDILTNPKDVSLYAYEPSTVDIESAVAGQIASIIEQYKLLQYNIENLPQIMADVKTTVSISTRQIAEDGQEKESSSLLSYFSAYLLGFMIYMFVFIYGAMVMQGVIEEKSSKVLEIMVSSVRPYELMMGKILGIAAVAITQFAIWIVFMFTVGTIALQLLGPDMAASAQAMQGMGGGMTPQLAHLDPDTAAILSNVTDPGFLLKVFGGFVVFFIGGYLLYAALFAAIGSAVDDAADTQQLQLPVTIPLILAIVVLMNVMRDPDGQMAFWFSLIPLTSPVIMMARIPYGVPFWQLALSVALLYASFGATVWLAGKIYRVGIFMYGKKPTWKELFKWMRYKY